MPYNMSLRNILLAAMAMGYGTIVTANFNAVVYNVSTSCSGGYCTSDLKSLLDTHPLIDKVDILQPGQLNEKTLDYNKVQILAFPGGECTDTPKPGADSLVWQLTSIHL